MKRRTLADAIEALSGIPVVVRGVECTVRMVADGRMALACPTVAGRYARAYRTLPPMLSRADGTEGFLMSGADVESAVISGFGSMHAADRFLAGAGVADA